MKNSVLRFFNVLIAALILLCLSSCAGLIQKTGSVSFEIGPELLKAARNGGEPDEEFVRIVVALEGKGYGIKQTVDISMEEYWDCLEFDKKFEVPFDNIPVGKNLYAVIKSYQIMPGTNLPLELRDPELYGKSDYFTVKAGQNKVEIKASRHYRELVPYAYNDTPLVIYDKKPGEYEYNVDGLSYEATQSSFCFDNNGNFYTLNGSNNYYTISKNGSSTGCEFYAYNNPSIVVDSKNNIMYAYYFQSHDVYITKYPEFISDMNIETSEQKQISTAIINGTQYQMHPKICTVNNGIVYIIATHEDYGTYLFTAAFDDSSPVTTTNGKKIEIPTGEINDIIYMDGAIYFLINEQTDGFSGAEGYSSTFGYYSRGALVKYKVSDGSIKTIGWTSNPLNNSGKYSYAKDNSKLTIYEDQGLNQRFKISADKAVGLDSGGWPISFPKFYVPSGEKDTKHLFGPKKFIAIKPKKLVIADEGVAFYTDENDAYNAKKVTRIVTVDLESFSMSCTNTEATFDNTSIVQMNGYEELISSGFSDKTTFVNKGIMDGTKTYYRQDGATFTGGPILVYIPEMD